MLDTKNEQKWPLTTQKSFLSQTGNCSQGSFHLYAQEATRDYAFYIFGSAHPDSVLLAEAGIFYRFAPTGNSWLAHCTYRFLRIPIRFCLPKREFLSVCTDRQLVTDRSFIFVSAHPDLVLLAEAGIFVGMHRRATRDCTLLLTQYPLPIRSRWCQREFFIAF